MNVAGIDVSTRAIDLVLLNLDNDRATWHRHELQGAELIDRIQSVRDWLHPDSFVWDDVLAVGIERPAGRYAVDKVALCVGAVLCRIPASKLTRWWLPAEWRKACGMKGNATKEHVADWCHDKRRDPIIHGYSVTPAVTEWGKELVPATRVTTVTYAAPSGWPQDACDAYCIAHATRSALEPVGKAA